MLILFKIFLIWFLFTACEPPKEDSSGSGDRSISSIANSDIPSKWASNFSFPIELKIDDTFSAEELSAITLGVNSWSRATDFEINFFNLTPTSNLSLATLKAYDDNELGIYKLNSWPSELPRSALAVTQIYGTKVSSSNGSYIEIDHADILINYEIYNFTTDDSWGYDLQTVIVHEIGHFLGLYHDKSSNEESVMYPTISRYDLGKGPKDKDVENILEKYAPRSIQDESIEYGERISMTLEIYPNGKERVTIRERNKVKSYEKNHHCHAHDKHNHSK